MTDQVPRRVVSRHPPTNELLARLRSTYADLAQEVAQLGDKAEDALTARENADMAFHDAKSEAEEAVAELALWRELLEDYRRGIVDRAELLEKTVGRG